MEGEEEERQRLQCSSICRHIVFSMSMGKRDAASEHEGFFFSLHRFGLLSLLLQMAQQRPLSYYEKAGSCHCMAEEAPPPLLPPTTVLQGTKARNRKANSRSHAGSPAAAASPVGKAVQQAHYEAFL